MNRKLQYICLFLLFSFFHLGCEKVTEVEIELPQKTFLIVQAELKGNDIFTGARILRSMDLNDIYSIDSSEIKGAITYLRIDGVQIVPLHYQAAGLYLPYHELEITPGRTYEIFVETDITTAYGQTTVPHVPEILEARIHNDYYLYANLDADPSLAFSSAWVIKMDEEFSIVADELYSVEIPEARKTFVTRTVVLPEQYQKPGYAEQTYIKVMAFDKSYYDYFQSKDNNKPLNNNFIQSGGAVNWNIAGNNALGLFIGYTESELTKAEKAK